MADPTLDFLFKLPQISTRSQARLNFNNRNNVEETKKVRKVQVSSEFECKRVTRSVTKQCLTTKQSTPSFRTKKKKDTASCAGSLESGYMSAESKDCDSLGSRESGISDLSRGLDSFEGFAESLQSIPNMPNSKIIALKRGNIVALIPENNKQKYSGPFELGVENGPELTRSMLASGRIHLMSPVVSLKPHGVEFHVKEPAILIIPLRFEPRDETWLSAVYSNTLPNDAPNWQPLPRSDIIVRDRCVVLYLRHLSLFAIIEEEPYPEILKKIRCRTGGRLRIPEAPGIEVNFPRGCLENDIDAFLRVLFDNEPLENRGNLLLASPIISLGPHGLHFNQHRLPVEITLPIPEYADIRAACPSAQLVAYQSSTGLEPMVWERIPVQLCPPKLVAYRHGISGVPIPTVTFPVYHFSFFKVVWDLLSSTVYEAKMGMSYFYPYISFSMTCQAFMEESNENNRFGLEVICCRSDRKLPETTNYRHRVGASLKPKLVRPGRIIVRLRSQMFEADVEAGEDKEMVKEEPDFRGRDFEKQYACRFKPDSSVERGTFGKVIVERLSAKSNPLFEFNLHKTGCESAENTPAVGCERWTVFAMKELASSLQISEGKNWKTFAKHIGFTKSEIKNKLSYSPDPFLALMNMYNNRGGTPEEFIQALYVVSRDIRMGVANGTTASPSTASSRSSQSNESGSLGSGSQESSPIKKIWNYQAWGLPRRSSESAGSSKKRATTEVTNKAKKRLLDDKNSGGSVSKKRRLSDATDEPLSTSSTEENEIEETRTVSTERHKKSTRKLNDRDLWRISSGFARKDWRNLGRTLGIAENTLANLEHAHQGVGFRECAYQMLLEWKGLKPKKCTFGELYSALIREKLNSAAKFMVRKISSSSDDKDNDNSSD